MSETGDKISILHVDDEPDVADLATTFLEREDDRFATEIATSADEGLERLSEREFDCIISDYDMPGQNGIELLKTVRNDHPDLPFILYTGKGSEEVASEAISAGVTDYLQKASGIDQYTVLANRIQNAVKRREAQRDRDRQLEAIETAQEGISILDGDGHYTYVNQRFADLHGYEPEEMIGEHWELVYRDDDTPRVREEILPEVERAGYWRGETTSLRADGSTVTVDHTLSLTEQDELICTVRDVSGRKKREQELRHKSARLEALFEHSPDMINIHDREGNIIDPNPRLCEKTGYDASDLTEMNVWDLDQTITPDESHALWEEMEVGDSRRVEGVYRCRDGSTFPVEVHIRCFRIDRQDRFVAIARDISERKERQTELERYERIIQNLPVGVFRTTPDGDFIDMNKQYMSLLGGESKADFEDVEAQDFWVDPDDRELLVRQLDQKNIVEGRKLEVETLDGESKWVETTLQLTEEHGDQYLDGVVQDITERRERERRLEQAETMFENAQDALFLIDVSDEFTIRRVNPAYEEATGFSKETLTGQTPRDILGDEQGGEIEQQYRTCVEQRTTLEYEEELSLDGGRTYWETRITPVVIDGQVEKIVGATRNITGRKEREQELRHKNDLFTRVQEIADIGAWSYDVQSEEHFVTDKVYEIHGLAPTAEMTPEKSLSFYHPDDRDEISEAFDQAVQDGEPYDLELRLIDADGTERWVRTSGEPQFDNGTVARVFGVLQDITDRTRRERELQQYETLIETLPIGYVRTSLDGEFLEMNSTFVDMLDGQSAEEIQSHDVVEFYRDATTRERLMTTLRSEGEVNGEELKITTMSGETIWVAVTGRLIDEEDTYVDALVQDITERKEYEEKLRDERAFIEQCLNALKDVFYVFGPDGEILRWNDQLSEVTGYNDDEIAGMEPTDFFPNDHASRITDAVAEIRETGSTTVQADYLTKDGERIPHEFTGFRLTDTDGEVLGFAGIGRDLTDRREQERQLEQTQRRMELALEATDAVVWEWNPETDRVENYPSPNPILDTDIETSETFRSYVHPEDRPRFKEALNTALETGDPYDIEFRLLSDGDVRWVRDHGEIFVTDKDARRLVIGVLTDITERKEHEDALEELHDATRDLMTATSTQEVAARASETATQVLKVPMNGIHLYDAETDALVPVAWTDKTEDLLDDSPPALPVDDSLAGQAYRTDEARSPADVREADETFNPDTPFRSECILPLGGHGVFIFSSPESDVFDATNEALADVFAGNVKAALDHVEQRQQLQRERDKLDEFANIISHDLRNPLNVATTRLELAQGECDSDHLDDVAQAHERMDTLIDDVLTLAQEGKHVDDPKTVDLADTIEGCWRTVETDEATLVTETELTIHADPSRLKQLLENLFRNAVEHGRKTVTVSVGDLEDGQGFYVADDGPGIPEGERGEVFDAGYSTAETGTGFGLSIVQEIVEAHGWDIAVTDSETGGVRFEITGVETVGE